MKGRISMNGSAEDRVTEILSQLRSLLADHEETAELSAVVPTLDDSPVRIALVGPFNAGKTMLVAALLEMPLEQVEELTAATPKTAGVTSYTWRQWELLDLPGTLSGLDPHDLEARRGVRLADVLMIVTTVELPGEDEARQIRQLLDDDGFLPRSIVVVNKANIEQSDAAVITAEISRRLGPAALSVPLVFTDARDFVDALTFPDLDEEGRGILRRDSGIDELIVALERLLGVEVHPRVQALCYEVSRLVRDASDQWRPSPEEDSDIATAERTASELAEASEELIAARDEALASLTSELRAVGGKLSSKVSQADGSLEQAHVSAAEAEEAEARRAFATALTSTCGAVTTRLAARLEDVAASRAAYEATERKAGVSARPAKSGKVKPGFKDKLKDRVLTGVEKKTVEGIEGFVAEGAGPGSPAHGLARRINKLLGTEAKPYAHVNRAKTITGPAQKAGQALKFLGPALDVKGAVDDVLRNRAISSRRHEIKSRYDREADETLKDERHNSHLHIQATLAPFREAAAPLLEAAAARSRERTEVAARLAAVQADAMALARGDGSPDQNIVETDADPGGPEANARHDD